MSELRGQVLQDEYGLWRGRIIERRADGFDSVAVEFSGFSTRAGVVQAMKEWCRPYDGNGGWVDVDLNDDLMPTGGFVYD